MIAQACAIEEVLHEGQLFEEMKGRIKEDDASVPYKENGYFYITRFEKGMQCKINLQVARYTRLLTIYILIQ